MNQNRRMNLSTIWRRIICSIMTFVMIISNMASPIVASGNSLFDTGITGEEHKDDSGAGGPGDITPYVDLDLIHWNYQYANSEFPVDSSVEAGNRIVDFRPVAYDKLQKIGFTLSIKDPAREIQKGDYIELTFPGQLTDLRIDKDPNHPIDSDLYPNLKIENGNYKLKIVFQKDIDDTKDMEILSEGNKSINSEKSYEIPMSCFAVQTKETYAGSSYTFSIAGNGLEEDCVLLFPGKENENKESSEMTEESKEEKQEESILFAKEEETKDPTENTTLLQEPIVPSEEAATTEEFEKTESEDLPQNNQEAVSLIEGDISIIGTVEFERNSAMGDDYDNWNKLLRPLEFEQDILLTFTYMDDNNELRTESVTAQDHSSNQPYYLKFTHDGEGAGRFELVNVPKVYNDGEKDYQITSYTVSIAPKDSLPYYETNETIQINQSQLIDPNYSQAVGTVSQSLVTQTITLMPQVVPEDSGVGQSFTLQGSFQKNKQNVKAALNELNINYDAPVVEQESLAASLVVPIGVNFSFTQNQKDGFKFIQEYSLTTITGSDSDTIEQKGAATGTVNQEQNYIIESKNYAQNMRLSFEVTWIDNNSSKRPTLTEDMFLIQYKTGDGEWATITEDKLEELGMEHLPGFDASKASEGKLAYTGLALKDSNNQDISYRIVVNDNQKPANYMTEESTTESGGQKFTFREKIDFEASIKWQDDDDKKGVRPTDSLDTIHLYRRSGNGRYELVDPDNHALDFVIGKGNDWTVQANDLPRYDDNNQEYDYVIVNGRINYDEDGNISIEQVSPGSEFPYKTYYDNNNGNYGTDKQLCHNHGSIKEVLWDSTDFTITKEWKDAGLNSADTQRPSTSVTLWRYVASDGIDSIDKAFNENKAAQVVTQTKADGKTVENIVQQSLDPSKETEEITFSNLPLYDDHGRTYVYFVREIMSGENSSNYTPVYQVSPASEDAEAIINEEGVGDHGKILNVRREKAAVSVTKCWKDPSGLKKIEGSKVQLSIWAPVEKSDEFKELKVYSSEAGSYTVLTGDAAVDEQSVQGFTEYIATAQDIYYVNIYDENGNPYDMSRAILKEKVTLNGETYEAVQEADGYYITIGSGDNTSRYKVASSNLNPESGYTLLGDGTKEFTYWMDNVITEDREYRLTKSWSSSINPEAYADVQSINMKLERRSTKDVSGQSSGYVVVKNGDSEVWTIPRPEGESTTWDNILQGLPKYDEEGYEYLYRATEVGFTLNDEDNTTISVNQAHTDRKWSQDHYRTSDYTKVVNYISTAGEPYFDISKIWTDDNDKDSRRDVKVLIVQKAALNKFLTDTYDDQSDASISLSEIANYEVDSEKIAKEFTLNCTGENILRVTLRDLYPVVASASSNGRHWYDYIVLEYKVGNDTADGARSSTFKVADLKAIASDSSATRYSITGSVENNLRQYETTSAIDSSNGYVLLSNLRVGITSINARKDWNDEGNLMGVRPKTLSFQLYQNGVVYENIPESVTCQGNGASLNRETGTITLTSEGENAASGDRWEFTLNGLPMFSRTGSPNNYNLDEIQNNIEEDQKDKSNENSVNYIHRKTDITSTADGKSQTYNFGYENTIYSTTSHIAYKYWKDGGVGSSNRPDLYFTLYRYKYADHEANPNTAIENLTSWEAFDDHKDPIQTPWTTDSQDNLEKNYNWKITMEDLPEFDANGDLYVYVMKETMNKNGETAVGTYIPSSETKYFADGKDSYEVFTNTISDYMTISGKKVWTGFAGYQIDEEDDLPNPDLYLYRTLDATLTDIQGMTKEAVDADPRLTFIDQTTLDSAKENYKFPSTQSSLQLKEDILADENTNLPDIYSQATEDKQASLLIKFINNKPYLPQFDENGERYYYLIYEKINSEIADQIYTKRSTSGTLVNQLRSDINRREIKVTKNWQGRENLPDNEKQYPSVTYVLYRYKNTGEDAINSAVEVARHTMNAAEFKAKDVSDAGEASYTFTDLLIYAPDGTPYGYYVKEENVNGYSTAYTDENGQESSLRSDITSLPTNWNDKDAENSVEVGSSNTYDQQGIVQLTGKKYWNDQDNMEGLRPDSITLTVKRYTSSESGQNNAIAEDGQINLPSKDAEDPNCQTPYIVWQKLSHVDGSKDQWIYTIYNLDRYAPNGRYYTYTITEESVNGYKQTRTISKSSSEGSAINLADLENSFEGSYPVRKNWMDAYNRYNLRPNSVTMLLERSKDGGETWSKIPWKESYGSLNEETGQWTGLPTAYQEGNQKYVSIELTKKNEVANTRNATWAYTFTNLPTKWKDGESEGNYTYRCREIKIGGVSVANTTDPISQKTKETAGAYECVYKTQDQSKTEVENVLNSTKLVVTKEWLNDEDDLYHSRPESVTFKLQKRSEKITDDTSDSQTHFSDWEDVKLLVTDEKGRPILDENGQSQYRDTFTISKSDNWTKTFEDLPIAEFVKEAGGTTYTVYSLYFRAVEVHAEDTTKTSGALNYNDDTSYAIDNESGHRYDTESGQNISDITNTLIRDNDKKKINITKIWHRTSGEESTRATFELLYKKSSEENWHCYGEKEIVGANTDDPSIISPASHSADDNCVIKTTDPVTQSCEQTITFDDLPKYDREGNELYYKVVEHPISGYKTEVSDNATVNAENQIPYATSYQFTNTELQDYRVNKIWQRTDDGQTVASDEYTASFKLQRKESSKLANAGQYIYPDSNPYTYVGKYSISQSQITFYYTARQASSSGGKKIMNDMARYFGALHESGVYVIRYKNQSYSWNDEGSLKGSNWINVSGDTLISQIVADFNEKATQSINLQIDGRNCICSYEVVDQDTYDAKEAASSQEDEDFTDIEGLDEITISNTSESLSYQWTDLPRYAENGSEYIYRAVESKINGIDVVNNSNGAYIVTYQYDGNLTPDIEGLETTASNRMVYGFVNLSKAAAYLAPGVTATKQNLSGIKFNIYKGTVVSDANLYVSNVTTDAQGNLIHEDGKYGDEKKYLVAGEYTLAEASGNDDYSIWSKGVSFKIGINGKDASSPDTGEHGTAWISTTIPSVEEGSTDLLKQLNLSVKYESSNAQDHTYEDSCSPHMTTSDDDPAYNIESRGVLSFSKVGPMEESGYASLDTHEGAAGENTAYFGVYTDAACTKQVAGMIPSDSDHSKMILTNKNQEGTELAQVTDDQHVPYLRAYNTSNEEYPYTLLSGTYYIKELVAPAGYKLDNTVRKAVVSHIDKTNMEEDLTGLYPSNKASIMLVDESTGVTSYQWSNRPNQVSLYKRDQYGRNVELVDGQWLELSIASVGGESNKFPGGESTIRLYQMTDKAATKTDGSTVIPEISYDSNNHVWIMKGLFDTGKTYTISEPAAAVPSANKIAVSYSFTIGTDGSMTYTGSETEALAQDNPFAEDGQDQYKKNAYKVDSNNNQIILRDESRNLKNVGITKIDSVDTSKKIANISFLLYKYKKGDESHYGDSSNASYVNAVLENGQYLTTDTNGNISINSQAAGLKNTITGCDLRYGLDVGYYYLVEVERGASDQYRLANPIFFEIRPKTPAEGSTDPEDFAEVIFKTDSFGSDSNVNENDHVSQNENAKTATVKNDPVTKNPMTLYLIKEDKEDSGESKKKLAGAKFELTYESINKDQTGAHEGETIRCITDSNGNLYLANDAWEIVKKDNTPVMPDISRKGSYTLKEIKAPNKVAQDDYNYMTRTENGSTNVVAMATFQVDSNNQIENVICHNLASNISDSQTNLKLQVGNERTKVSISKLNDIANATKHGNQTSLTGENLSGASLEIYEGIYHKDQAINTQEVSPASAQTPIWTSSNGSYAIADGTLKENQIYTLHESQAPVGYLEANDIYFKIFGTVSKTIDGVNTTISQIYVWTGSETPTLDGASWSKVQNIKDQKLTMVDEAVIAPVDLRKVLEESSTSYTPLAGVRFEVKSLDDNKILGYAETTSAGYLVWKEVKSEGYASKLIYNEAGKRVTTSDSSSVIGKSIILQQNHSGYSFTESHAPDNAYNDGRSYTVKITKQNYLAYRNSGSPISYKTTQYVNIVKANANNTDDAYSVDILDTRVNSTDALTSGNNLAVNLPYKSRVTLHKYDNDEEANKAAIQDAQFTLYQASKNEDGSWTLGSVVTDASQKIVDGATDSWVTKSNGIFTTDSNGNVTIQIPKKGYYILKETAATGYDLANHPVEFKFQLVDQQPTDQPSGYGIYGYDQENTLKLTNDGVANTRLKGKAELTKKDKNSNALLDGVVFTLTRTDSVGQSGSNYLLHDPKDVVTGKKYVASQGEDGNWTWTESDGESGKILVEGLNWGTYQFTETTEADGYVLKASTNYPVTINATNVTVKQTVSVENEKNALVIDKYDLNHTKIDQSRTVLADAYFHLYEVTSTSEDSVQTVSTTPSKFWIVNNSNLETDKTDKLIPSQAIYGLKKGNYILREIVAPAGYELRGDVYFTMNADGSISNYTSGIIIDANGTLTINNPSKIDDLELGEISDKHLGVTDQPIEIQLDKVIVDRANSTLTGSQIPQALDSAKYQVTGIFADTVKQNGTYTAETREFTGNSISSALKALLVAGKDYTIKEIQAPKGYEVEADTAKIHVNADGSIQVTEGSSFLAASDPDNNGLVQMTFRDQPIELKLSKVKEDGQTVIDEESLTHASFTVSGKMVKEDGSAIEEGVTVSNITSANFTSTLSRRLIQGETYTVSEITAPYGYKITTNMTFTVDSAGKISAVTGTDAKVNSETDKETLLVSNHPNTVSFSKMDDHGPLAGARFTLTACGSDTDPSIASTLTNVFVNMDANKPAEIDSADDAWTASQIKWTSTTSTTELKNHLIAGVNYKLHEDRVKNHEVMTNDIIFHLENDGSVVITHNSTIPNNPGVNAAAVVGTVITIGNPIIRGSVVLTKYYKENSTDQSVYDEAHVLKETVKYKLTMITNHAGQTVSEIIKTGAKANGVYPYSQENAGNVEVFETDANGKIIITGLPEGTYQFQEIDAPLAYHINESAPITFTVNNADAAHVLDKTDMDTRINAKIKLTKINGNTEAVLPNTKFDVKYSPDGTQSYVSIGSMTTGEDGVASFAYGKYTDQTYAEDSQGEGLRRGYYQLVEIDVTNSNGYMMNTTNQTRNSIFFQIDNRTDHEYVVGSDDATYTLNGSYMTIIDGQTSGAKVANTPIPEKTVTVSKTWNDTDMDKTFRPTSIQVSLYRSYHDGSEHKESVDIQSIGSNVHCSNETDPWKHTWRNLPSYVTIEKDGMQKTYLYTYWVEEVPTAISTWEKVYSTAYEHTTASGNAQEANVQDGNTNSAITNTVNPKELIIQKTLGGGSAEDTFKIRVKVSKTVDGETITVGNNGYYLDTYTVKKTGQDDQNRNPDSDGWVSIHGDESLTISLPKGVSYEVEEKQTGSSGAEVSSHKAETDYAYTTRYMANPSGTMANNDSAQPAVVVRNAVHKSISLTKTGVNSEDMSSARYKVIYRPRTESNGQLPKDLKDQPLAIATWTKEGCKVVNGKLCDAEGNILDLTPQGSYEIYETKAPASYITPTDNNGNPILLATVTVSDQDIMTVSKGSGNATSLVSLTGDNNSGIGHDGSVAELSLINEKSRARLGKTIDYAKETGLDQAEGKYLPGAELKVYKVDNSGQITGESLASWTTDANNNPYTSSDGLLEEGQTYLLRETSAPNGYKKAQDLYFRIEGTYTVDNPTQRYSRLVITDSNGDAKDQAAQNMNGSLYGDPGLVDGILKMVDETIIAPIDLQKVLANRGESQWDAVQNVEFTITDGNNTNPTTLGTAVTNEKGYLVWKTINAENVANSNSLLYDASGHMITESNKDTLLGKTIILRQNETGYILTESYAPDHVYNDSRSYHVYITEANYNAYRITANKTASTSTPLYDNNKFINVVESEKAGQEVETNRTASDYVVSNLTERGNTVTYDSAAAVNTLAVNLSYKSTITLHKYDGDLEAQKAAIPGTQFTLYRDSVSADHVYQKAYTVLESGDNRTTSLNSTGIFTTDDNGNLTIEIPEKGNYILVETQAATGYQLKDPAPSFHFTLQDASTDTDKTNHTYGYGESNTLTSDLTDNTGLSNERKTGSVSLEKRDNITNESLDGVVYTLTRTGLITGDQDKYGSNQTVPDQIDLVTGKQYEVVLSESGDNKSWSIQEKTVPDSQVEHGKIIITGLAWGEYTLVEKTEKSGYVLEKNTSGNIVNRHTFTINGKDNQLNYSYTGNTKDTNAKNHLTFYKNTKDSDALSTGQTEKGLAGAVFEVHEGESCGDACNHEAVPFYPSDSATSTVTSVTTAGNGKVDIYGLATNTANDGNGKKTYHLVETLAPKGYILQTNPTVFTIDRQGKVEIKGTSGYQDATDHTVPMTDEPIKIYIQKTGENITTKLDGAEFDLTDTCTSCDHKFADGSSSEHLLVNGSTDHPGKIMIPIEHVIAGHTYSLRETKAPDGYECTAVVTFTVATDGTVESISSEGGYQGSDGSESCASLDTDKTSIFIQDELVRMELQKLDYSDHSIALSGVSFTITPYGKVKDDTLQDTEVDSSFNDVITTQYYTSKEGNVYTYDTADDGKITFDPGLLKHNNSYLLQETSTIDGYYLGKEAQDGVILYVDKAGKISISRLSAYQNKKIGEVSSCPVTVNSGDGNSSSLTSLNMKSTSFDLKKLVEGNMGDLKGEFQIRLKVEEADGTLVGEKTVKLKWKQKYDSVNGTYVVEASTVEDASTAFGKDAIPVGAKLTIVEDDRTDYAAVIKTWSDGTSPTETNADTSENGRNELTLNETAAQLHIELLNKKEVILDVGLDLEDQAPWAMLSLMIPALWLVYRYRRKREGGDV